MKRICILATTIALSGASLLIPDNQPVWAAPANIGAGISNDTYASPVPQLTAGVKTIAAPGLPGIVATFSNKAFPVVAGKVGKNGRESVVAAVDSGKTRIVAFGHDGFLNPDSVAFGDTAKLFDNALTWVSGGKRPTKIGVIAEGNDVLNGFKARGYNVEKVQGADFTPYQTLIINGHAMKDSDGAPLKAFLERGGGLVMATTGWGWSWNDNSKELARDFVGNQVLAPYGIVWTMGTLDKTTENGFVVEPVTPLANASNALGMIQTTPNLTPENSEEISSVLGNILTGLPSSDTVLMPALKELASGANGDIVPMDRRPVTMANPKARLIMMLQTSFNKDLPPSEVKPNPAGAIFPGDVPPNYKPVTKTVSIDTKVPDWHSLGLYAAPGTVVTVKLPDGMAPSGLAVRIGCHTDKLYGLDTWKRAPDISRIWALQKGETKVANPFGGLVYVVVPETIAPQKLDVTVSGAYEAPLYREGQTSLDDWKKTIRWAPGPWAEIATNKLILTVPSRSVRDLDDPAALCAFYDKGMDAAADLYGIPKERKRPERIVADEQISAGYMHSGYPIMTWLDVEKTTVDLDKISKFPWGHFHELGHNHQQGDWTFAGTGEVTNNLLPLYIWNVLLGHELETGHPAISNAEWVKRWTKYEAEGHPFKEWQSDPWLALGMYMQLQKAFGWKPFSTVFAQYHTLSEAQRPQTDEQKHDQWMVRMSQAVGKNLGPFFVRWGVPTSQAARDSIANLPTWMPDFPKAGVQTVATQQ